MCLRVSAVPLCAQNDHQTILRKIPFTAALTQYFCLAEAAASAAPSTPVPALQNNIISRPRMFTTLHTTARPTQTSPAELRHAAKMARLSGFAYKGEDLADLLAKEGLSLVARGESHFTRCVCQATSLMLIYSRSISSARH